MRQAGGCHIKKIPFRGIAMLPIDGIAGRVSETLQLAERLSQHGSVVGFVDDPVPPLVFFQKRRREAIVAETAPAFPVDRLGNAARIFAVNDFFQTRNDMRVAMLTQLYHDPAAAHLVGDCPGCAGPGERIEDEVAGVGGNR